MQTVTGAWPMEKLLICWGTLSSRIRKLALGILGMKRPLLSSTATSTLTRLVSTLKLGVSGGNSVFFLLLSLEGMGRSESRVLASFLCGLATVFTTSFFGPWAWAAQPEAVASSPTIRMSEILCIVINQTS